MAASEVLKAVPAGRVRPPMVLTQLGTLAVLEMREAWRGRWLPAVAAVWALVAFLVVRIAVQASGTDAPGFEVAAGAVFDLGFLVVPLLCAILGATAFSSEGDAVDALWLQPIDRAVAIVGRAFGLYALVAGALAVGLLPAFMFVGRTAGPEGAWLFGVATLLLCVLALFFLGVGTLTAGLLRSRIRSVAGSLAAWLLLTGVYDAALMGFLAAGGSMARRILAGLVLLNPPDAVRVVYLLVSGSRAFAGPAGASLAHDLGSGAGPVFLGAALVIGALAPLAAAAVVFRRADG